MSSVGKLFEYFTYQGEKRTATCVSMEFHKGLRKILYTCVSPYGNTVRLTKDEIHRIL